jgi:hypothetical protein
MSVTPAPIAEPKPPLPPSLGMLAALESLRYATAAADDVQRDRWEFAVGIRTLAETGADETDLRRLVAGGFVEHARGRRRLKAADLLLSEQSRFVLTPAGERLLAAGVIRPRWDREQRQLWYGNVLVKSFRQPAASQETVLSAFEDDGWPPRIDDPLPPPPVGVPNERLHDAVRRLNCGQLVLVFRRDGSGEGVTWAKENGRRRRRRRAVKPVYAVAIA